jgi:simple sugar transport system permease protein
MIEAGLVATGIQGFWVRAVEGVVFLGAVIFHLVVEDRGRVAEVWRRFGLLRRSY